LSRYGFKNLEQARDQVLSFVLWYNNEHQHSALHYVTPRQRHSSETQNILTRCQQVIVAEKARHPQRWSSDIRNLRLTTMLTDTAQRRTLATGQEQQLCLGS